MACSRYFVRRVEREQGFGVRMDGILGEGSRDSRQGVAWKSSGSSVKKIPD